MIEGVRLKELVTHSVERGFFREIIRRVAIGLPVLIGKDRPWTSTHWH